ncbi:NADH dehydrogenase [Thermococcus profundus]|uniref:NADH dehydrogenase n=1 Tax=Thermococcus profundus TaxID=49899 RepID=A0A2Z2MER5_THEPR|nr:proton-conducting transporter membrane subunit [Thermococcus profundus]ASJ03155.1 NADH dehydrogenase [Thermococcus profundus]
MSFIPADYVIPLLLLVPAVSGVLAWIFDTKGIREILGLIGGLTPLVIIAATYGDVTGEPINYSINAGVFTLNFQLSTMTWYFAAVAAVVAAAMVFGLVSTTKSGYEWMFSLLSVTGLLGVFTSHDFAGFFLFWEIMTFASFMMVLRYNRHASLKYFVLSVIGAYSMLLAIAIIYAKTGALDFSDVARAMGLSAYGMVDFGRTDTILVYALFLVAFGVKAGTWPLHVWAPEAYSETNQSYTSFFSGALSKAGIFGFVLVYALMAGKLYVELGSFHGHPTFTYIFAWLGAITVVVASFLAVLQEDIRKLLAYSSVGQVGYILLAIGVGSGLGFAGAFFHVLSHALFKGLFWLVTAALILRTGKTRFEDFGGLAEKMPITFAMGLIAVLSLAGIPPMAGFASKWLIYEAAIQEHMPLVAGAIFLGSALAFAYVVRFLYAIWFGQRPSDLDDVQEAPLPLLIGMGILGLLNVVFGIAPGLVVDFLNKFVNTGVVVESYYSISTATGTYNALSVALILVVGIAIAGLIYIYGANARKIPVTNTYQSGNPVTEEFNLSIRRNFYRPLAEALEFWLRYSFDRFYERLSGIFEDFADWLREGFYNGNIQSYSWYLAVVLLILALWGVL